MQGALQSPNTLPTIGPWSGFVFYNLRAPQLQGNTLLFTFGTRWAPMWHGSSLPSLTPSVIKREFKQR